MSVTAVTQDTLQSVALGQHFQITPQGLAVNGAPSFDAFEALGETLRTLEKSIQFAVGDFFREVEARFGERASQLLDATAWSEQTIRTYRWTAKNVAPQTRRMDVLTYSHHQVVAKLAPAAQKRWLDRAAEGEERQGVQEPWTVSHLQKAIKAGADPVITAWYVVTGCDTEAKRDELQKELERRGFQCKATERRE